MSESTTEAQYWWQVTAALPTGPETQEYHALRRIWGDHTMDATNEGRGYCRWRSEDGLTPGLFQIWAIFGDANALRQMLTLAGIPVRGRIGYARWAYAHEEEIPKGSMPGFDGRFRIADIILYFEDEEGPGLIAFEAKRPGNAPNDKDAQKLQAYANFASMQEIPRRFSAFILGRNSARRAATLKPVHPVITWEQMRALQMTEAINRRCQPSTPIWIDRTYARHGISRCYAPTSAGGGAHGDASAVEAILARTDLPERERYFLLGSETFEAFRSGRNPPAPLAWLRGASSRADIASADPKMQLTAHRRVNRWHPTWTAKHEAALP